MNLSERKRGLGRERQQLRRITYGRSAAGLLTGWAGVPGSMPNFTMVRLECAVAGQLQCLVRRAVAWGVLGGAWGSEGARGGMRGQRIRYGRSDFCD